MNGYIEAGYVVALAGVGGYGAAVATRRRRLEKVLGLRPRHAVVQAPVVSAPVVQSGRRHRPGGRQEGLR